MNTVQSLISPVLEYASSFNRFDYFLVYISLSPVCFHSYQATTVWWRADVMYRMPSTLMLFPGNEQEMLAQVLHSHVMFPFQSFWWGIWTRAKIIRPTLTVCSGIKSMYTQRNVEALIFWFCLFPSSCGFFQREACLFRDKPRLLRHSSSLSLIHKPDGSSFSAFSFCLFFALWFDFSSLLSSAFFFFLPYVLSPPLLLCFLLLLVFFF